MLMRWAGFSAVCPVCARWTQRPDNEPAPLQSVRQGCVSHCFCAKEWILAEMNMLKSRFRTVWDKAVAHSCFHQALAGYDDLKPVVKEACVLLFNRWKYAQVFVKFFFPLKSLSFYWSKYGACFAELGILSRVCCRRRISTLPQVN